jgi:hypothetical protein
MKPETKQNNVKLFFYIQKYRKMCCKIKFHLTAFFIIATTDTNVKDIVSMHMQTKIKVAPNTFVHLFDSSIIFKE